MTTMDRLTGQLASMYRERILEQYADYHRARAETGWWDRCRHGTYIGNPYGPDYMCGMCEDGAYTEGQEALMLALDAAKTVVASMNERSVAVQALYTLNAPIDTDVRKQLGEWIWEAIAQDFDGLTARHVARTTHRAGWRSQFHPPVPPEPSFEDREAQAHYDDTWRS